MSREVRRTQYGFEWPINETWWGYILDSIPCQACQYSQDSGCQCCDGEGEVRPKVDPPAIPINELPKYWSKRDEEHHGWQMWQTVSEGSPISPVCKTPEELAHWLADNGASSFGSRTATYEQWLAMIEQGWAPSAVLSSEHGLQSGVEAAP